MKKDFKLDYVNYEKEILVFKNSCCFETLEYVDGSEEFFEKCFEFKNDKYKEKNFFYIVKNELKEKFYNYALSKPYINYIKNIDFRIFAIRENNCFYEIFHYFEDCMDLFEYTPDLFTIGETILRIKEINGKILFIKRKVKYFD